MDAHFSVLIAVAIPNVTPLINFIGAFCFSILGVIIPAIIETITFWNTDSKSKSCLVMKNAILVIFGFAILVSGSYYAFGDVTKMIRNDLGL